MIGEPQRGHDKVVVDHLEQAYYRGRLEGIGMGFVAGALLVMIFAAAWIEFVKWCRVALEVSP